MNRKIDSPDKVAVVTGSGWTVNQGLAMALEPRP